MNPKFNLKIRNDRCSKLIGEEELITINANLKIRNSFEKH